MTTPPRDGDANGGEDPASRDLPPPLPGRQPTGSNLSVASPQKPPVRTGLEPEERARLNELRVRVESRPYPFILGAGWEASRDELERKACLLEDWLKTLAGRPDLDGDTRATVRICLCQVELAGYVLGDPELSAAYTRAAHARHERSGAAP